VRPENVDESVCRVSRNNDEEGIVFLLLEEDGNHGEKDAAERWQDICSGLVYPSPIKRH
jgi:hypothetical protein